MRIGRKHHIERGFRIDGGTVWERREPTEGEFVKATPEDIIRDDGRRLWVLTSETTGEYLGYAYKRLHRPQQQHA